MIQQKYILILKIPRPNAKLHRFQSNFTPAIQHSAPHCHKPAKIKSKDELYSILRAEEVKKINSWPSTNGGTEYMQYRLIVRDKDKLIIDDSSIFDTLCALGRLIGFEKIQSSGAKVQNGLYNFNLVCQSTPSDRYKRNNAGWFVLANASVPLVALALNELFDATNSHFIASIVIR